jgi:hypothetical protein
VEVAVVPEVEIHIFQKLLMIFYKNSQNNKMFKNSEKLKEITNYHLLKLCYSKSLIVSMLFLKKLKFL